MNPERTQIKGDKQRPFSDNGSCTILEHFYGRRTYLSVTRSKVQGREWNHQSEWMVPSSPQRLYFNKIFFRGWDAQIWSCACQTLTKRCCFSHFRLSLSTPCLLAARPATTLFSRARTHMETDPALTPPPAAAAAAAAAVSRCQCPRRVAALTPGLGTRRARKQALVPDTVPTSGPDCYLHVSAPTLR